MKKKILSKSNKRLYITSDIWNDRVFYVRTEVELISRLLLVDTKKCRWEMYFYPYKLRLKFNKLKNALDFTERQFKKYWSEKYEIHN